MSSGGGSINYSSNNNNNISTAASSGRSWLEGTLNVISGMAPRPSTPLGGTIGGETGMMSGPASPMSTSAGNNTNGALPLRRLPSQDSLDRSIHNDSSHNGNKSTAQIIADLKKANARLTAQTAELEADFMNQFNNMTMEFQRKEQQYQDSIGQKEKQLKGLELRCRTAETTIREQDEEIVRLREESAFQRHSISDLRTQLQQIRQEHSTSALQYNNKTDTNLNSSNNVSASQLQAENKRLIQQLDALKDQSNAQHAEQEAYIQQLQDHIERQEEQEHANRSHKDDKDELLQRTKDALEASQQQIQELQQQLDEARSSSARRAVAASHNHRDGSLVDATPAELRQRIQDYADEVDELTEQLNKVKAEAYAQDQYRREEADDLRLLHDAQEEEITSLKKQLEETAQEMALREQEWAEQQQQRQNQIEPKEHQQSKETSAESNSNWSDHQVIHLQQQVLESKESLERLQRQLTDTKEENKNRVNTLKKTIDQLVAERNNLRAELASTRTPTRSVVSVDDDENHEDDNPNDEEMPADERQAVLSDSPQAKSITPVRGEKQPHEEQDKQALIDKLTKDLSALREEKEKAEKSFKEQLESKDALLNRSRLSRLRSSPRAGESTSDTTRVASLVSEVERLKTALKEANSNNNNDNCRGKQQQQQSGGSVEEDLRKELARARQSEERAQKQLESIKSRTDAEIEEMQEKLSDRDTTISALAKSSVSLEQQIASYKLELDYLRAQVMNETGNDEEEGINVVLQAPHPSIKEISDLRDSLAAYKETEQKLSREVFRLKKQAHQAKQEAARWRNKYEALRTQNDKIRAQLDDESVASNAAPSSPAGGSSSSNSRTSSPLSRRPNSTNFTSNISHIGGNRAAAEDRDEMVNRLVKQNMSQERVMADLRRQLLTATEALEETRKQRSLAPEMLSNEPTLSLEEAKLLRQEAEVFAGQVIELDEEIESLKKTISARDDQITVLMKQLADAKANGVLVQDKEASIRAQDKQEAPKQAQEEAEKKGATFTNINTNLNPPNSKNAALSDTTALEAEIDELKEANSVQRDEIRQLRRKIRELESASDRIDKANAEACDARKDADEYRRIADEVMKQKVDLEKELQDIKDQLDQLEQKRKIDLAAAEAKEKEAVEKLSKELEDCKNTIEELRSITQNPTSVDEMELESLRNEITSLQHHLDSQSTSLDEAKNTIRELESLVATKNAADSAAFEEEKEELIAEIESLTHQLEEARDELESLEKDHEIIDDFKKKLEAADEARSAEVKSIVDSYERKLSLLKLDKDVTIDKLRNELAEEKERNAFHMEETQESSEHYKSELEALRQEMAEQIEERESRVFELENTLAAQEQLIENMKTEMDHLQGSMESAAVGRREEIEGMQQELVALTSTAARQDREIKALTMQLEQKKEQHESEVRYLKETIDSLKEQQLPSDHRTASDLQMDIRLNQAKERLEQLNRRNGYLKEENDALRDRISRYEAQMDQEPAYQEIVSDLQEKLTEKTSQLAQAEQELAKVRATAAAWASKMESSSAVPGNAAVEGSREVETKAETERRQSDKVQPPSKKQSTKKQGTKKVAQASPRRFLGFGRSGKNQE